MLCALGATVFATATVGVVSSFARTMNWIALATGFGLTTWLGSGQPIDASWIGGLVAILVAWQLLRPGRPFLALAAAGALAALWASLLQVLGVPRLLAVPLAAIAPIVSASLARRRPAFAPLLLREEAMLTILILALVVGMAPTVSQGWRSALALNVTGKSGPSALVPIWMMSLVGASMALGGLWSLWRRG